MLVVRGVDLIFNKWTPGRDGGRYKIQPRNMILAVQHRALFIFCALFEVRVCSQSMCALKGYAGTVTRFGTSCSLQCHPHFPLPSSPPPPPFPVTPPLVPTDWTTRRPFMPPVHQLDCTLGSLCHRARSCRLLPLFGFW